MFEVPPGHHLVVYDYGTGGLWWFIKAESAQQIRDASPELTVLERVPNWMREELWQGIETDDLDHPKSKVLQMILAEQD